MERPRKIGVKTIATAQPAALEKSAAPSRAPAPTASLPPPDGIPPSARAADFLAVPTRSLGAASRAGMMSGMQQTVGNARVGRMLGTTGPTTAPAVAPPARAAKPVIAPPRVAARQPAIRHGSDADRLVAGSPGEQLPPEIQITLEHSFGVDLHTVRVHQDTTAQKTAQALSARAFTHGPHIFLGPGEQTSDLKLMAHEVAHVVQQQSAPTIQRSAPKQSDPFEREAQQASDAAASQQKFAVQARTDRPRVQRLGISDALDYIADKANLIPGFRMFTIILGVNPVNMSHVERSAANILRALIEFIPGGGLITQALDNHGILDKVGNWVQQQIQTLGMVGSAFKQAIDKFLDSLGWSDILSPGDVWQRAKRIFTEPIDRIISFAKELATGIIKFIKDAILMPLAKLAEGTRGWDLLIAVLGKNPITGDPVPRTAETLIGGFLKLIGQEEVWANMKKANALGRAWAWFQGALSALMGFVSQIPTLAINAFKSLELMDIVLVPRAFLKVAAVFGNFIGNFISWAGNAVWKLLEIIFDAVSPGALGYIKKTGAALKSILKNPLPFVGNLVKAAKLGFLNFADNIGTHLKAGLIDWLTGSLPNIYIPKAFSLVEIGKFVLSVLGITWAGIRGKIVKALGPNGEKIMSALETTFDIVVALVKGGPAAAWEVIKDKLTNLKDMVIGGITDFVIGMVVKKAIPKLIAMFIPGAGFISAILSIYDTVMVFVNKISKIIQVVTGFIDSIVAIAGGAIGAAAGKVEGILAGLLSLAINFLAGFASLGNVADKIMGVLEKVRSVVDKALDTAINWIVGKAKALFAKLFGKSDKPDERTDEEKKADLEKGLTEADNLLQDEQTPLSKLRKKLSPIKSKYKMTSLDFVLVSEDMTEGKETIQVVGEINPKGSKSAKPHNLRQLVASLDPINSEYRGHIVTIVSGPLKGTSVTFDALGFPDFSPFAKKTVTIVMHGNRTYRVPDGDFGNANEKAGYDRNAGEPSGYTWHHHQDRKTMQLVKTTIHDAFRHSGGVWVIAQLGEK
jgi:Domain of unknown function (DUF4157)/DNase/tRNase domain of colicin-like bacteriocin